MNDQPEQKHNCDQSEGALHPLPSERGRIRVSVIGWNDTGARIIDTLTGATEGLVWALPNASMLSPGSCLEVHYSSCRGLACWQDAVAQDSDLVMLLGADGIHANAEAGQNLSDLPKPGEGILTLLFAIVPESTPATSCDSLAEDCALSLADMVYVGDEWDVANQVRTLISGITQSRKGTLDVAYLRQLFGQAGRIEALRGLATTLSRPVRQAAYQAIHAAFCMHDVSRYSAGLITFSAYPGTLGSGDLDLVRQWLLREQGRSDLFPMVVVEDEFMARNAIVVNVLSPTPIAHPEKCEVKQVALEASELDNDHMRGFEKESLLRSLWSHPEVFSRLYMWKDFRAVAEVINPELCEGAFLRRPCRRWLRYLGQAVVHGEQEVEESGPFKVGEIYLSVDFNGGAYTIEGYERPIGYAYWEIVDDQRSDSDC